MSSFHIRPRFRQVVDLDPTTAQDQFVSRFTDDDEGRFEVKSFPGFVSVRLPEEDRHFWSPRLHLSFEEGDSGKTLIRGMYGPNANVWSIFLYGYIIVGFLGLITAILGISQAMIGAYPWGFWGLGMAILAAAGLYLIAQTGQKLGAQQTFVLHRAYERAAEQPVKIH